MSHHYASKKSSPNLKIPRFHSLSSESFIVLLIHFELDFGKDVRSVSRFVVVGNILSVSFLEVTAHFIFKKKFVKYPI